ncbi:MAG: IS66 family insertion sequence element accessory protein TnpA, partial [Faecousia sp.]
EQSLQVMSKQERLENWTAGIMACRSSGMTVRAWCQENGLSEKTYYYWQRRLFQALAEQQQQTIPQPAFTEITLAPNVRPSGGVAVTVRISGVEANIYNGADAAAVETVLRILKSC